MMNKQVSQLTILILLSCVVPLAGAKQVFGDDVKRAALDEQTQGDNQDRMNPQVVRISYLEGDVRVARALKGKDAPGTDWEMAIAGLPVETGFNLATGAGGRAEIEFEDTSTVYLHENSVLTFNDLHTEGEVPYTSISLLSGTATLHVNKSGRESFFVSTPTSRLAAGFKNDKYLRVTSYSDGFSIATRQDTVLRLPDWPLPVAVSPKDKELYFHGTGRIETPDPANAQDFTEWDKWVDERVTQRAAAMTAVMKEAGLTTPVPGLADMKDQGTFFKCEPYGTCWEPKESEKEASAFSTQDSQTAAYRDGPMAEGVAAYREGPMGQSGAPAPIKQTGNTAPAQRRQLPDLYYAFPCAPEIIRYSRNSAYSGSGLNTLTDPYGLPPYDWTRCHAGFWIQRRGHYTWVAHHRIHHHCPVRWVKTGHTLAYVPLHPHDVRGKLPINREHGVFAVNSKVHSVQAVNLGPHSVKVLDSTPKEFAKPVYMSLARATAPHIELHPVQATVNKGIAPSGTISRGSHAVLAYNHKSQSFMVASQITTHNGRTTVVTQTFGGHNGALQAHQGGVDSHGNYSMRAGSGGSGGSFHGGGTGGGSHSGGGSGGGSHSGGGGSGGGGGSHGGGGGSSGGGSGGGSSSGGGSHH
jgi:hypothetical protein